MRGLFRQLRKELRGFHPGSRFLVLDSARTRYPVNRSPHPPRQQLEQPRHRQRHHQQAWAEHFQAVGGMRGWQWMFLIEGAPVVLLGLVVLKWLPDGFDLCPVLNTLD